MPWTGIIYQRVSCASLILLLTAATAAPMEANETRTFYGLPNPLSLEAAQAYALRQSPDVRIAAERVAAATAVYQGAFAGYYPSLALSAEARHTHDTPMSQSFVAIHPYESYGVAATVNWLIFDGLAREYAVLAARAGQRSSEALAEDVRRLLLRAVAVAFHEALLAAENVRISREDAVFNRELAGVTRQKFDVGAASRGDLLNFEIRAAEADERLLQFRRSKLVSRLVLAELMGLREGVFDARIELSFEDVAAEAAPLAEELATALRQALTLRPELVEQRAAIRRQEALCGVAKGQFWPTLTFQASYGQVRWDDIHFNNSQDASSYYGLSAAWNIFAGGRDHFRVRESQALARAAAAELERREIAVITEVRTEVENWRTALARLKIQTQIQAMTKETQELVLQGYRAGTESLTRLNEVQADLVRASAGLAQARIRLAQARENLTAATGRNWDAGTP